jgi:hypothetical protein
MFQRKTGRYKLGPYIEGGNADGMVAKETAGVNDPAST